MTLSGLLPASGQSDSGLDRSVAALRQARADTTRLRLLLEFSARALGQDQNQALQYARQALRLSRQQADSAWQAQAWLALGKAQQRLGQPQDALQAFKQAQGLSQRHNLLKYLAVSFRLQGVAYAMAGRPQEAEPAFRQALAGEKRFGDPLGILGAYGNLAALYQQQGRFKEALALHLHALTVAEQHEGLKFREQQIRLLNNIGVQYNSQREYQTSNTYAYTALRLLRASPNPQLEVRTLVNLSDNLINLKQDSAAQRYVTRSLALLSRLGEDKNPELTSPVYLKQAALDIHRSDYAAAIRHVRLGISYAKTAGRQDDIAAGLFVLADAEQRLGHYAPSVAAANECLRLGYQIQDPTLVANVHKQLATTYAAAGRFQLAFASQNRFQTINDSIFNAEKAQQLGELATRYQTEQKQTQIKLLQRNATLQSRLRNLLGAALLAVALLGGSTYHRYRRERRAHQQLQVKDAELERTQAQLYQSLGEKEVLLKEIHHRVKNNLQVIASRLALQEDNTQLGPATLAILRDSQNWVKSVALVHEMLYRSEDLASVAFQPFLEELAEQVHRTFAGSTLVTWAVEAAGITLSTDAAVPLGLAANELLSNAYKYAFTGRAAGHIRVVLAPVPSGGYCLRVTDDGVGLPADFILGEGDSLGLPLVLSLARRLEGRFEAKRLENGTEFRLFFSDEQPSPPTERGLLKAD